MREHLIQVAYLAASVLFIMGLRGLTSPATARRGIVLAEVGMLVAIVGTLLHREIVTFTWIVTGMVAGSIVGALMAVLMPMTAVPQRTAVSHAFGALAATLVGVAEYHRVGGHFDGLTMAALGFEVMFGSLTITGSLMAFGKLQELLRGAPITYRLQNASNIGLFLVAFALLVYLVAVPTNVTAFYVMIACGLLSGVLMVLPIGGADMPVVISLLNSYAGLASAATGFVLGNYMLIIAGALDGASGFILSVVMSKAMNRSFRNVLFGAFGGEATASASAAPKDAGVRTISVEDLAVLLGYGRQVVVVPGYGMAVAQAQHEVREVMELLERRGVAVTFGIHPVAGRMPGHMNVLLAEANVPYDHLKDMEEVNPLFPRTDVAVVIGANDVVNPAARSEPGSPIYGMPILDVDQAANVVVLKRSMATGFAGIENQLFFSPKTQMYFGDAKKSLAALVNELRRLE